MSKKPDPMKPTEFSTLLGKVYRAAFAAGQLGRSHLVPRRLRQSVATKRLLREARTAYKEMYEEQYGKEAETNIGAWIDQDT